MRIQHNIAAINSHRQFTKNNNTVSKNLERLSSGYRINSAADDAAGLAISEKMRAQITGLETASTNASDGISLIQTAEGNLQEVHDMLNRMTELATQSANGTYDDETDRANIQKEFDALKTEINRISKSANFNGIKLLDGNLANNDAISIENSSISSTAGVSLEQGTIGAGTKGQFTIDLSGGLFGSGDELALNGTNSNGAPIGAQTFKFTNSKTPSTDEFTGATAEEQAESLAAAMKGNSNIGGNFDITVDGSKVILTAIKEGTGTSTITSAATTDVSVQPTPSGETQPAVGAVEGTDMGWNGLFGAADDGTGIGYHIAEGDKLTFKFNDGYGNILEAEVEVTASMIYDNGGDPASGELDIADVTTNIVNALNETAFKDLANTAQDESNIKVKDMFDLTANQVADGTAAKGSIQAAGQDETIGSLGDVVIKRGSDVMATVGATVGTLATPDDTQIYQLGADTNNNYSAGDVLTVTGKLSDGSDFTIKMEAGKDFDIGADYNATADNIAAALNTGKVDVTVTSGNKSATVKSDTLFNSDGKTNFKAVTAAMGVLEFQTEGGTTNVKGGAGKISSVSVATPNNASAKLVKDLAKAQDYASSSIEISKDIQYGATVKVGDATFEVVKDARDTSNRNNQAVVITDLENKSAEDIAKAISDAIADTKGFTAETDYNGDGTEWNYDDAQKAKEDGLSYSVAVEGNKITISSLDKGSTAAAPEISTPYGDKTNVANVKINTDKLKYGDTIEINGKSYEFTEKESDVKAGNTAVVLDLKTADAKAAAQAVADVAKGVKTTVAEDGTLTIQSQEGEDGVISDPKVISENNGLSLQVGDTSESFQKVNVKIRAVNTTTLGLDEISVDDQSNAENAIDVIKSAINQVSSTRGDLGALQNRLEHTINNLETTNQNMTEAESRIRDVDMAKEMMEFTKNNVLVQASQSMLAQANQQPQGVLQLLQ